MDGREALIRRVDRAFDTWHWAVAGRLRRRVREVLGEPSGGAAFKLLALVAEEPRSPSELAARLQVRTSTMTVQLDRLEDAGWVRREPVGTAGRVRVVCTEAGRQALARYAGLRLEVWRELLEPFDDAAVDALGHALETTAERLTPRPAGALPEP